MPVPIGRRLAVRLALVVLSVVILGGAIHQRAASNLRHIDYSNSNFVFFWLAGRMIVTGQNPYDSAQWLAAHDANGVTWRPNLIFPYPLPLAALVTPLGLLSLAQAYYSWQLLSQALIALVVWFLLSRQGEVRHTRLFVPVVLILLFFGPVLLSLQIGALGALTLAAIGLALASLDRNKHLWAGLALSLALLKPPQGLPILLLVGIWLFSRRDWRAMAGMGLGALGLLSLGMLIDPHWIVKFGSAGRAVMDRTLGLQSNAFGFAYHGCNGDVNCMWLTGGAASAFAVGLVGLYLWRRGTRIQLWEALNVVLPTAFFSTPYLWSYDQILYVFPIIWIVVRLTDRTRSYLASFGFLTLIVAAAFLALLAQAKTRSDLWSVLTTVLVMAGCLTAGVRAPGVSTAGATP